MVALTWPQVDSAFLDLRDGFRSWRLGQMLAWQDIKQRYRRSTLGPVWITLSTGIQMLTIAFVNSFLFKQPVAAVLPHICAGLLFWNLITQVINDGAQVFIASSAYMTAIKRSLTVFLIQVILRNLLMTAHNAVIYIIVAIIFVVIPSAAIVIWPLGFILVLACLSWMVLICGIVSARYRDVPVIITNVLGILFWLTPVMYLPSQLGANAFIARYNPFTYMLALLREPLLGGTPTLEDWLVVAVLTILGWAGTFLFFARFRARIIYWL